MDIGCILSIPAYRGSQEYFVMLFFLHTKEENKNINNEEGKKKKSHFYVVSYVHIK